MSDLMFLLTAAAVMCAVLVLVEALAKAAGLDNERPPVDHDPTGGAA